MKKPFCVMPWIHVHTRPNGDASPCCVWDMGSPQGNTMQNPVQDIAHSANFNKIRQTMMQGVPTPACASCITKINSNSGKLSYRDWQNANFSNILDEIPNITNSDGSLATPFKMRFLNIRYSNLCNMACRTCGSFSSSMWAQEQNSATPVIKISTLQPNYINGIINRLPEVEVINFAGGESILIPEHWIILDELVSMGKTDVKIIYTTNLSKLSYQNKNILDYSKIFPNMIIKGSVDAMQDRAELYRHGTNWAAIEKNLKTIFDSGVPFKINCTVGAMNVWHAPDLQQYLIEQELIKPDQFYINMLSQCASLSAQILPLDFKEQIKAKITKHKLWLTERHISSHQWDLVINFMMGADLTELLPDFIQYNQYLDSIRNQNTLEVFPELTPLMNYA